MKLKLKQLGVAFVAATSCSTFASEDLTINGFLTAGISALSTDEISYDDVFVDEEPEFRNYTRFGVQIRKQITDEISVTGQFFSSGLNNFDVETSWAYVSYQATDELTAKLGRFRAPLFHYSEFLDVGYAYHWITPPADVYRFDFSNTDAFDVNYTTYFGDFETGFEVYFGGSKLSQDGTELQTKNAYGVVFKSAYESFSLRVSYHDTELYTDEANYVAGVTGATQAALFNGYTPEAAAAFGETFALDGTGIEYYQASFGYNDGDNLVIVEWTGLEAGDNNAVLDDEAWMISFARRINSWTPHITYSEKENEYSSGLAKTLQVAGGASIKYETNSLIVGVKYDWAPGIAIKCEITQHEDEFIEEDGLLYGFAVDAVY